MHLSTSDHLCMRVPDLLVWPMYRFYQNHATFASHHITRATYSPENTVDVLRKHLKNNLQKIHINNQNTRISLLVLCSGQCNRHPTVTRLVTKCFHAITTSCLPQMWLRLLMASASTSQSTSVWSGRSLMLTDSCITWHVVLHISSVALVATDCRPDLLT